MSRDPQITPAPGGPRRVFGDEGQFQREVAYGLAVYLSDSEGGAGTRIKRDQSVALSGDHVSILEIDGPAMLGIRIGSKSNPFLPVRAGSVWHRSFDVLTVRFFGNRTGGLSYLADTPTQMLVAGSFGPLMVQPGRDREGFHPGFITFTVDVGAAAVDITDPVNWVYGADIGGANVMRPQLGRFGGTMRLHNRDAASSVFIFSAQADPSIGITTGLDSYSLELEPRQKEEFRLASSMRVFDRLTAGEKLTFGKKLFAQTTGPTVRLACTVNQPFYDSTDADAKVDGNNRGVSFFS